MAHFKPGESGNPAGRPKGSKGFAAYARSKVGGDGEGLVDFWHALMQNETAEMAHRLKAAQLLADRAFGKAPQPLTGTDGGPVSVEVADPRERLAGRVDELADRRRARAASG